MNKKLLTLSLKKPDQQQDLHSQDTKADSLENITIEDILFMLPGNIYWKDRKGRYLGCNSHTASLCNFTSPNDIVGKRLSDILIPEIAASLEKNDFEVMSTGHPQRYEETGIYDNNKPATFLSEKLPIYNPEGTVVGLIGVSFDITERKQMEENLKLAKEKAEEATRAKSRFLAIINHELRTPLTSILGLLSFIKQENLSAQEHKEIIKNMENCTSHLLNLVNDVLEFSRLETGNYHLRLSPVSLNTLLLEVYNMLQPLALNKDIELILDTNNLSYNLHTNAHILRQVFINLVANAIKFTEKGSVSIRCQLLAQTQQKVQLKIDIVDTGIGIPANKLDLIFDPFLQLENPYLKQSSRGGTGLGLSIVKKLASLINADIKVTSEQGVGSTFSLAAEFDIATTPSMQQSSLETGKESEQILSYQPLILLIEDDPIIQYIHQKMLQNLGCLVEIASSGQEALQKLNHHQIVFIDISLPDISGFEVIKSIRKHAVAHSVPIVALTAYDGKEEKSACLEAGADMFKSKPISIENLKKILTQFTQ